jgi:hypothetical protein
MNNYTNIHSAIINILMKVFMKFLLLVAAISFLKLQYLFSALLGFELRDSHFLGKCSTTSVTLAPFCVLGNFEIGLLNYFPRLASNHDPSDLCLLGN